MERCRAAERHERPIRRIFAVFDRMHAGRVRHVLVDDLIDARRRDII